MVKPVMLAVDDPQLLRAVERDLRRGHRVLRADPGESVLDKLPSGDPAPLSLVTWPFYRPRRGGRVRLQLGERRFVVRPLIMEETSMKGRFA